jgi:LacI family transcriptional regulator
MATRVTIQDIADALDLSRNTVSKALNNTGVLADATREKILNKAMEMGYKHFSYASFSAPVTPDEPKEKGEIAVFTTKGMDSSHFASPLLDKFYCEITQLGYSCTLYRIFPDALRSLTLPASFSKERTAGILCLEMLDTNYSKMLCCLDIPVLFSDSSVDGFTQYVRSDYIITDNQTCIYQFINEMIQRGKTKIGFIGEYRHSLFFCERYLSFRNSMFMLGLPIRDDFCILGNKELKSEDTSPHENYSEYLIEELQKMKELPEVFLCANDFVAIDALQAFKKLGIKVPKDVYLCGFDDTSESRVVTPTLTTIHTHSQIMAITAAELLLSRIEMPSLNYRIVHTETSLIYRESTED